MDASTFQPDNLGLKGCLLQAIDPDSSDIRLESMWQEWCTEVSVADFFVIAGEVLIEATLPKSQSKTFGNAFHDEFRDVTPSPRASRAPF